MSWLEAERLHALLVDHQRRIAEGSRRHEFVDRETADNLRGRLREQLDRWHQLGNKQRAALAEAIEYLARIDDDENDLASPVGFDDDAEVVEDALRRINWTGTGSERPST